MRARQEDLNAIMFAEILLHTQSKTVLTYAVAHTHTHTQGLFFYCTDEKETIDSHVEYSD